MKKREILTLNYVIKESLKIAKGAKFCYGLLKNEDNVKPEIDRLKKIEDGYREGIKEFDEAVNAIIMKMGKQAENSMVQVQKEDMPEFQKEVAKLEKKHKEKLDVYNVAFAEYQKTILDEEMETPLDIYKVSVSYVSDAFQEESMNLSVKLGKNLFKELIKYGVITDPIKAD